jgi:predicted DNA-binding protein
MCYMRTQRHDAIFSIRVPQELLEELRSVKSRDGIPAAEQIRRALVLWFATRKKGKK